MGGQSVTSDTRNLQTTRDLKGGKAGKAFLTGSRLHNSALGPGQQTCISVRKRPARLGSALGRRLPRSRCRCSRFLAPRPSPSLSPPRISHWLPSVLPPLLSSAIRSPGVVGLAARGGARAPIGSEESGDVAGGGRLVAKLRLCQASAGFVVGGAGLGRQPEAEVEERCRSGYGSWGNGGLARGPWTGFSPSFPDPLPRPLSWAGAVFPRSSFLPRSVAVVPAK